MVDTRAEIAYHSLRQKMNCFVGIMDYDRLAFLSEQAGINEVNFIIMGHVVSE
jgi:hypothetical protein